MQFGRDGACVTTPKERSDSEAVMELWRSAEGKTKAEEPAGPAAVITIPEEDSAAAKEVSASMEDLFARAVAAGLTSETAVITMRINIAGGYFSEQHYRDMWSKRLGDHANSGGVAGRARLFQPVGAQGQVDDQVDEQRRERSLLRTCAEYEILFGGAVPKFTWPTSGSRDPTLRRAEVAVVGDATSQADGRRPLDYWVNGSCRSEIFTRHRQAQVMQFGRDAVRPAEGSDSEAVMELWRSSEDLPASWEDSQDGAGRKKGLQSSGA